MSAITWLDASSRWPNAGVGGRRIGIGVDEEAATRSCRRTFAVADVPTRIAGRLLQFVVERVAAAAGTRLRSPHWRLTGRSWPAGRSRCRRSSVARQGSRTRRPCRCRSTVEGEVDRLAADRRSCRGGAGRGHVDAVRAGPPLSRLPPGRKSQVARARRRRRWPRRCLPAWPRRSGTLRSRLSPAGRGTRGPSRCASPDQPLT